MKRILLAMAVLGTFAGSAASLSDFTSGASSDLAWPTAEFNAGMSAREASGAPAETTVQAGLFFATGFLVSTVCDPFAPTCCWTFEGPSADVRTKFGCVVIFR